MAETFVGGDDHLNCTSLGDYIKDMNKLHSMAHDAIIRRESDPRI